MLLSFILAILPILVLVFLLGVLRISGEKAGSITLLVTFLVAIFGFDLSIQNAFVSFIYGGLKAVLIILLVIVAAIYSYNVLVKTGYIEVLKNLFANISTDKGVQVLLMVWAFGGLLEAMAGFGTAVAIPAAILISLGFNPLFSSVVALIANSVPTAFGAIGIPVIMLGKETDLPTDLLSTNVILQLSILNLILPIIILYLTDSSKKALKRNIGLGLLVGVVTFIGQYIGAKYIGVEFPAIIGALVSMLTIILYAKFVAKPTDSAKNKLDYSTGKYIKAWAVYGFIFLFILLASKLGFKQYLGNLLTSKISVTDQKVVSISWLTHTGILIFLGAFIGGLIQGACPNKLFSIFAETTLKQWKTAITLVSLVGLSTIMVDSSMIKTIAQALAEATGNLYPLFAPTIGCLGTFITGSDTSSNILFGKLQAQVAGQIHADPAWLSAANTTGATGGKIISPQSIIIATSSTGQDGQDGIVMKKALPYAIFYIIIGGLMTYILGLILY